MRPRSLAVASALLISCAPPRLLEEPREARAARIAFTNVTLIDGTGAAPKRGMTVVVAGDRIESVIPTGRTGTIAGARVVDGSGKYMIPGLIETHAHWFVWFGSADNDTTAAAARGSGVYLANGVTTVIDASARGREDMLFRVRDNVRASGRPLPRIYLSGRVDSLAVIRAGATDAADLARRHLARDVVGIKIHRGLDISDLRAVVAEASKLNKPVFGHTYELLPTRYHDYTRDAVEAGVAGVFHVLGMAPVRAAREPPLPPSGGGFEPFWLHHARRWLYVDDESADSLIQLMIMRGAWLQPTLVTEELIVDIDAYRTDPAWRYAPFVQDPDLTGFPRFAGADLETYRSGYERMRWFVRRFHEAGGLVVAGTDGVRIPGFGMQDELRLLAESGLPPLAALQTATRNAARAFHLDAELGTIERGKLADMVLLEGDPLADIRNARRVFGVVSNGVYHDRAALDALLAAAERPVPR